jgi:hypothetical protein
MIIACGCIKAATGTAIIGIMPMLTARAWQAEAGRGGQANDGGLSNRPLMVQNPANPVLLGNEPMQGFNVT